MITPTQKNVVRCTLQSYLGKDIKGIVLGARQREAVHRLSQLNDDKFDELCSDTINEIHRRSGVKYDTENKMQAKFCKLNEERFKSLIIDILTVFYIKNPAYEMENFPEFVGNVKLLINQLKIEAEKTLFMKRLETEELYNKMCSYVETTKNGEASAEFPNEIIRFFEFLSFPKIFIDKISKTEILRETDCQKLEECRKRLVSTFLDSEINYNTKSDMAKYDITQIIEILHNQATTQTIGIECFDHEIKAIIEILDSLTLDMMQSDEIDLNLLGTKLLSIMNKILRKADGRTAEKDLYKVNLKKIPLESLGDLPSKTDSFELIIDVIKGIRNFFEEIKA